MLFGRQNREPTTEKPQPVRPLSSPERFHEAMVALWRRGATTEELSRLNCATTELDKTIEYILANVPNSIFRIDAIQNIETAKRAIENAMIQEASGQDCWLERAIASWAHFQDRGFYTASGRIEP